MTSLKEIQDFTNQLAALYSPDKVVLFGSYATGVATEDSDVDLLVLMPHAGKASAQALDIRRNLRRNFPLDLIVQAPEEAARRVQGGDPFLTEALGQGRTLYERN
jgi:predicted nucleotidyltransferase